MVKAALWPNAEHGNESCSLHRRGHDRHEGHPTKSGGHRHERRGPAVIEGVPPCGEEPEGAVAEEPEGK